MKKIFILLVSFILLAGLTFAAPTQVNFTSTAEDMISTVSSSAPNLKVTLIRQDPIPASPGSIVDLYFSLSNIGGAVTGPKLELIADYPFEIDASTKKFDSFTHIDSGDKITLHYKLKVDENAAPGEYEIEFRPYSGNNYYPYFFNVVVDDVLSDFDVAVQEVTEEGVSVALSNIGDNDAGSITVDIIDNGAYRILGFPSYIIGNLNAGDYTLLNTLVIPHEGAEIGEGLDLNLNISYTDVVGNRRAVEKTLPIVLTPEAQKGFDAIETRVFAPETNQGGGFNFFLITTIVLIIALIFIVWKNKKKWKNLDKE